MRYWLRIISLMLAALCLGVTSGLLWLGILASAVFGWIGFLNFSSRKNPRQRPAYSKFLAYGLIVPCAIWWVVTPSVEYGVSPYLVYIPAWYLLSLSLLQLRSLGRGGFEAFVAFDGIAAILASTYLAPRLIVATAFIALLLYVFSCLRRDVAVWKFLLLLVMFAGFAASSAVGFRYWKDHRHSYAGKMAEDFYLKNRVMGFDPAVSLGSFRSNFESRYNKDVVLRVWDTLAPRYMRASTYEKYMAGLWKLPSSGLKKLYPARYQVDYAVFDVADSSANVAKPNPGLRKIWVQSTVNNFGFLFTGAGAVGVAVKNVDSLDYYHSGIFATTVGNRSDWYYFVPDENAPENAPENVAENAPENAPENASPPAQDALYLDLAVSEKYFALLDSVIVAMGLGAYPAASASHGRSASASQDSAASALQDSVASALLAPFDSASGVALNPRDIAQKILAFFRANFKYSLVVPGHERGLLTGVSKGTDPLYDFWNSRQGYCEYFATLSTLVMRRLGIPARYVTGFVGGERVEGRPYIAYRRYNSHAWVEFYENGRWVSFDPTPPSLMAPHMKPSWFSRFAENMAGRFGRLMHVLKDGEWRNVVEDWQQVSENLIREPLLYVGVALLFLFYVVWIRRRTLFRTKYALTGDEAYAAHVAYWSKILERSERKLARLGFVRSGGETVCAFVRRVESSGDMPKVRSLLDALSDYEKNRWKKLT